MAAPPSVATIRGFTLFEVLIAVLVLSLGLLGLAALQSAGLRNNHGAYLRSQATVLAYDIIDRMRSNKEIADPAAPATGGYDLAMSASPPSSPLDCVSDPCSSADLATYELNNWIQSLAATLPLGDGQVSRAAGVVTVTVAWDDTRSGVANQQFVMSTQL